MGTNSPSSFMTAGNATSALSLGSGVLGAVSQIKQGNAAQAAADAQSQALTVQSNQTFQAALDQATKIRRAGAQEGSSATAALGASGVNVNQGSAGLVRDQIDQNAQSDALVAIASGSRQASTLQTQAALVKQQGADAASGSKLSALATGIGAVTKWKRSSNAVSNTPSYGSSYDGFNDPSNYG